MGAKNRPLAYNRKTVVMIEPLSRLCRFASTLNASETQLNKAERISTPTNFGLI